MLIKKEQYEIAIAALLHDIGKFKQRAYEGKEKEHISQAVFDMEPQILPVFHSRYSYRHALWTYDFFLNDLFPLVKSIDWDIDLDWEKIARESASHHSPVSGSFSEFIAKADRLSAGIERYTENFANDELEKNNIGRYSYLKKPLKSIFASIGEKEVGLSAYSYDLNTLSDANFPQKAGEEKNLSKIYLSLWEKFIKELRMICKLNNVMQLLSKLKDTLLEFTWCIPSATNDSLNDISLYDHSVVTMSLAIAMACSDNQEKPFRLFAADVSGIQSFIFQSNKESFRGAAKAFRGRSFIISALSTAYRLEVSDVLGLIPFTDIIDAGGKFTIILPNTKDVKEKLDKLQKEQETYFLYRHLGTLCVLADYSMEVDINALSKEIEEENGRTKFSNTQIELSRRLNACKSRKFNNVDLRGNWVLRNVNMHGSRCEACGVRVVKKDGKCEDCSSQIGLGGSIVSARYVCFVNNTDEGVQITKNYSIVLKDKPLDNSLCYLLFNKELDGSSYPLWRLNNYAAEKEFDEIASSAVGKDNKGKAFLAYLKIDVDNLGEIFIRGLPKEIYTLSRYVAISRLLNYFFNVQVRQCLEEKYPDAYTVISGGDDVFVIMPWNQVVDFVLEINQKFKEFCCNNDNIHFSSGIVVTGSSVPFALVNKQVDYALNEGAKKRKENGNIVKNGVKIFNQILSYEELQKVKKDSDTLIKYINNHEYSVSSSFVYRIFGYVNDMLLDVNAPENYVRNFSSYSKLYYDLARNIKGQSNEVNEARSFFLSKLKEDSRELEQFKVALILVMYSQRETIK